jgi:ribosomal protein S18 acetylase RimI-like enzyme
MHNQIQEVTIKPGLDNNQRNEAAQIYFDAFSRKLTPLIGEPATAVPILARNLEPSSVLTAIHNETLLGFVGLHHKGQPFLNWQWEDLTEAFGFIQGTLRYGLAILFMRNPPPGVLLLDGIAVSSTARGKGVGRQLLTAVANFGQEHGYHSVQLDVVDTNPAAQRLYERMGFQALRPNLIRSCLRLALRQ